MSNPLLAAVFAGIKHAGQVRKFSGEPYVMHPYRVARIIESRGIQAPVISAALLHDVVEDCGVPIEEIQEKFGGYVARLVKAVSNPEDPDDLYVQLARAPSEAASIKLADIIDNCGGYPDDAPDRQAYFEKKRKLLPVLSHGDQDLWNEARLILFGV